MDDAKPSGFSGRRKAALVAAAILVVGGISYAAYALWPRENSATAAPETSSVAPSVSESAPPSDSPSPSAAPSPSTAPPTLAPATSEELFAAVNARDGAAVAALVQRSAPLNDRDEQGRTPVMVATYNNDVPSARALIEAGADVNIRDDLLNNPFLYSGAEGYLDILRLTITAGADPALLNRFGGTALIPAAEHGHLEVMRELLTNTAVDIDHVNKPGWTALLEAIVLGDGGPRQQEAVQLLVDHGADVSIGDRFGVSPLSHARNHGFTEIARILQEAGAQ